ncbi:MAG: hypothetical protein IH940_08610 [Acidobacteria bacterium]|nr:hypothetical protein [Acidobacteriota bacterium]
MRSRTIKTTVLVVSFVLTAAACAGSGEPDDYDPVIEENFTVACEESNDRGEGEPKINNVVEYCGCVYEAYEAEVPYEDFKLEDDLLRDGVEEGIIDGIDDLSDTAQDIINGCIAKTNAS